MFFMIYLVVSAPISVNIFRSIVRNEILENFYFNFYYKKYTRLFLKKLFILISSIVGIYIAILIYFLRAASRAGLPIPERLATCLIQRSLRTQIFCMFESDFQIANEQFSTHFQPQKQVRLLRPMRAQKKSFLASIS